MSRNITYTMQNCLKEQQQCSAHKYTCNESNIFLFYFPSLACLKNMCSVVFSTVKDLFRRLQFVTTELFLEGRKK